MRKFSTNKLCLLALCSVINLIGGHIALLFRLPVYLDSLGTVFAAALMGPLSGMIPGLSLIHISPVSPLLLFQSVPA